MDFKYKMLSILIILLSLVVVKIGETYFDYKIKMALNKQRHEEILLLYKIVERANEKAMLETQENMYRYLKGD